MLNIDNNVSVCALFMDLKKAFDCVDYVILKKQAIWNSYKRKCLKFDYILSQKKKTSYPHYKTMC